MPLRSSATSSGSPEFSPGAAGFLFTEGESSASAATLRTVSHSMVCRRRPRSGASSCWTRQRTASTRTGDAGRRGSGRHWPRTRTSRCQHRRARIGHGHCRVGHRAARCRGLPSLSTLSRQLDRRAAWNVRTRWRSRTSPAGRNHERADGDGLEGSFGFVPPGRLILEFEPYTKATLGCPRTQDPASPGATRGLRLGAGRGWVQESCGTSGVAGSSPASSMPSTVRVWRNSTTLSRNRWTCLAAICSAASAS